MSEALLHYTRSLSYGLKTIDYRLTFAERKTLTIAVHPDTTVSVKAPSNTDIDTVEKRLSRRARWILKQQNYFRQFDPKTRTRSYLNGETHLYLGKRYRLKAVKGEENKVKLLRGYFQVSVTKEPTPDIVEKLMTDWYAEKARAHFTESLERCWPKFATLKCRKPAIAIRRMKKGWGSLSESGTVILNSELIKAPRECIDYVVTHELCHLKYRNHDAEYYKLLGRVLPGWERVKHKLEVFMA